MERLRTIITVIAMSAAVGPLAGCAARGPGSTASVDASAAASPAPGLVGTWKGMAWAVPGSAYYVSTPVELTIAPDGTFSWSRRGGEPLATGVVRHADPHRVILMEHKAATAEEQIELMRTGDRLWGMSTAFMAGHPTAVELNKVNP